MTADILVSTPDLRPSLLSILQGLAEHKLLGNVATTIAVPRSLSRAVEHLPWAGSRLAPLLRRREVPGFLDGMVDAIWAGELLRNLSSRFAGEILADAIYLWAVDRFDRSVARRYAGRYPYIYGMDFSSAATFAAQKLQGGHCIQRQVSAHFSSFIAMLRRECERFPQFANDYYRLILNRAEAHERRRAVEHGLADLIVANSDYVLSTFVANGVPAAKVVAVPTGCPPLDAKGARSGLGTEPVRFVYAGRLSLRKGFHYLMHAWQIADFGSHAELWVAGGAELELPYDFATQGNVRLYGVLNSDALVDVYRASDIMVLPTLSEGLSHAVLEALSFGMPVITTAASGAGTLVTNENGIIVPEGDAEALASAMIRVVAERSKLPEMGKLSAEHARVWTVANSNEAHVRIITEFLKARR
ncbi:MAG TPA: glycosyltransferase family 4 protein [Xanthobacteraceae bacterium]|jgi:glycosyltransferase involved in cell wall biosynthesis|nr:glycosyltransferase family 4 protein [Xanthobacteraceae bacterium]